VHSEWNAGAMDGFFTTDGINCMGYYTAEQLPFYYSLFDDFTLCGNYFCSVLGPTWPNRFYLAAGTSGGITTNGVWGYGVFDYPIILDLLEDAGVTWKVYNIGWDSVPFGNTDNVFVFWKRWAHDRRTLGSKGDYLNDLRLGRLPQVSFIVPSFARGWDEHPPADVSIGMGIQQGLITALQESSAWKSSAYVLTYDEHASTLKLIETVFGLPTLASVNHRFDASTPGGPNNQASGGLPVGPPAPPRDGLAQVGNMMECFEF
jgi:phospholipase C